jgi:hypothetical protein
MFKALGSILCIAEKRYVCAKYVQAYLLVISETI